MTHFNISFVCMYVFMYGRSRIYSKSMDQPGKVANPARGQLNRENEYLPRLRLRTWSRETGSAVLSRVSLLISLLTLNMVLTYYYGIHPVFRGGVHLFIILKPDLRHTLVYNTVLAIGSYL